MKANQQDFYSLFEKYKEVSKVFRDKLNESDSVEMPITFLGCLGAAIGGDIQKRDLIKDNNDKAAYVYARLSTRLQNKFKNTLENMIKNLAIEKSTFLDWVGEIQYFYHILKFHSYAIIEDIEYKLPNGKSVDCRLKLPDDRTFLIDFVSIHPDEENYKSEKEVKNRLHKKVHRKYLTKTKGIQDESIKSKILIFPIVWIDPKTILKYKSIFQNSHTEYSDEYYAYYSIKVSEDKYDFDFKPAQFFLPN
jgi:hypothetical protein